MILAAIEALKERNGSSKRAISKFIRQTYGDASPQHDKNLAQNLRRMTREQVLRMVKRSYKIASSSSPQQPAANPKPRGRPRKNLVPLFVPIGTTVKLKTDPNPQNPPAAAKRRGRPPKALRTVGTVVRRKPGRPRKVQAAQAAAEKALIPVPVAAAVRKRGRPRRQAAAGRPRKLPGAIVVAERVRSKPGRGPGRPPKAAAAASAEGKRSPGRPRKLPAAAAAAAVAVAAAVEKSNPGRKPGRPPKSPAMGERRKPGRPRKMPGMAPKVKQAVAGGEEVAANPAAVKRRGRPPKRVEQVQSIPAEEEKTDEAEKQVEAEKKVEAEQAGPSAPEV
uniref:H15 domain-containing protein n=1 Tax=Ananas comosus var. bracteatus TaxID=296719 RepID=A0A6V7Q8G8_ANACO|nr:unnamed protein product [Ananas comosus var. bracteatus]